MQTGLRALTAVLVSLAGCTFCLAEDWPAWRGPRADGTSQETDIPLTWSTTENVTWTLPLPEPGNSTPIVWGNKIFLTQSTQSGSQRALWCIDRDRGSLLWQQSIPFQGTEAKHDTNTYCASSPVTDGKRVIAWHGSAGVVAYDMDGQLLWHKDLGAFEHIWGSASSPILFEDLVILNLGPGTRCKLVALKVDSGMVAWERDLPAAQDPGQFFGTWSTPVIRTLQGKPELVLSQPGEVHGYDPTTGQPLWKCHGLTDLVYTTPLISGEIVVAMSGYMGAALAVRANGQGDLTDKRLWHVEKNPQRVGSGMIVGDHLYMYNEQGIAACHDLQTGSPIWEERIGGRSWTSLVSVGDNLMVLTDEGETVIFKASPQFQLVGKNALDGVTTRASLAVSDGQIFIRSYDKLYCIGQRQKTR